MQIVGDTTHFTGSDHLKESAVVEEEAKIIRFCEHERIGDPFDNLNEMKWSRKMQNICKTFLIIVKSNTSCRKVFKTFNELDRVE